MTARLMEKLFQTSSQLWREELFSGSVLYFAETSFPLVLGVHDAREEADPPAGRAVDEIGHSNYRARQDGDQGTDGDLPAV